MKILEIFGVATISLVILVFINLGQPKSIGKESPVIKNNNDASKFLKKFGYLSDQGDLVDGILKYQNFYKLSKTGKLDTATIRSMNKLRCQVPDFEETQKRQKRFVISPYSWTTPIITWAVVNYTEDLTKEEQLEAFEYAFEQWSLNSHLVFSRINSQADINLFFTDIDGENGVLGAANLPKYPNHNVTIRFDEGEKWSTENDKTHLSITACHEIGHALGLLHSDVPDSMMFAQYVYRGQDYKLHVDDKLGLDKLYEDSLGCISGDGIVLLKDGSRVPLRNLNIGDAIQISEEIYSPVLTMLDRNDNTSTLFIHIRTSLGNSLKLTPKHLIAVQSKLLEKEYMFAEKLQKGSKVYVHSNGKEVEDEIVFIERIVDKGYYAPLTNEGILIVNGIEVSCYAIIEDQDLAHLSVTPLRWFLQLYEMIFEENFDKSPTDGIHWYGRWSYNYVLPIADTLGLASSQN